MDAKNIDSILEKQRLFFKSGETLSVSFRIEMLKRLKEEIRKRENDIATALFLDLGKSSYEAYMCEIGMALSEISYMIKHVKSFAKPKKVHTPLAQFHSRSYTLPSPYGNTLIMSPWNYPFLLTVDPIATAIAAGNTVIAKPSAYSPNTSAIIESIISDIFPEKYVAVIKGGRQENAELIKKKFDFVFFTGSQSVGKEVLRNTAEHLTPAVLELGGKSPCIVDFGAKIGLAARRIVFAKFLNCGQTCVAPDYVLCDKRVKDELVKAIIAEIKRQFTDEPLKNESYGKIINEKHFERLISLIDSEKCVYGGDTCREKLKISPTVIDNADWNDAVMQEEIFGPILPILTFDNLDGVIELLSNKPRPLALYLFSERRENIKSVTERCSFGGGCVNDCIIHLATSEMGFGGVGESGMGAYHGRVGFEAFSHRKSIVNKGTLIDLSMRYQPYKKGFYERLLRFFLK